MGFEYENLWSVSYNNTYKGKNTDSLNNYYEILRRSLKSMPEVKDLAFCSDNIPFSANTWSNSINYGKHSVSNVDQYTVTESYKNTLNMQLLEGRWFDKGDAVATNKPVVINSDLKETLFGEGSAVGKILGNDKNKFKVIGVVQGVKEKGDYAKAGSGMYYRADTGAFRWLGKIIVKVEPGANAAFEARLYKTLSNYMKDSNVEIEHLVNKRTSINYFTLVPMIVLLIVGGFLTINVALGLFGVLWYNINKRRGEIGLRRAVGASGSSISWQLIAETLVLATFSLIIGSFFAVQFPLLNVFDLQAGIYLLALLFSVIFIYALVIICAAYPGKQAAAIYPAVALHEE
jgi:putative ABC transport system permease protein